MLNKLNLAKEMARKSTMANRHGAVLWSGGKICGCGYNHTDIDNLRLKKIENKRIASIHAEMDCLNSCLFFLKNRNKKKCNMLVIRLSREDEKLCKSEPCSLCTKLLKKCNVKKVFYTTSDGRIESIRVNKIDKTFSSVVVEFLLSKGLYGISGDIAYSNRFEKSQNKRLHKEIEK